MSTISNFTSTLAEPILVLIRAIGTSETAADSTLQGENDSRQGLQGDGTAEIIPKKDYFVQCELSNCSALMIHCSFQYASIHCEMKSYLSPYSTIGMQLQGLLLEKQV